MTCCCKTVEQHKKGLYVVLPDDLSCNKAAHYGHLDCIRYFRDHGFPWNKITYAIVICKGDLESLRYFHETKDFLDVPIQCFDFDYNIRTNSVYMQKRKPCYRFLIEKGYSFGEHEQEFEQMFAGEEWFRHAKSVQRYLTTGETDDYSAHLDTKVRRIQHEWLKYAYHPKTQLGRERMMSTVKSLHEILLEV